MKKLSFLAFAILFMVLLISCETASGTNVVTGKQRPATNPNDVVLYSEPPANYEVIGVVTASSDSGWTEQEDLNYAIAELKKQAAKIGANGVILENISTSESGGIISNGIYFPATAKNISGKAIYVKK